jgi:hypothetical protein
VGIVIRSLAPLLRGYAKSGDSREAEFWRGNFVGMKRAVFAIYGKAVKDDVIDRLRRTTNLPFPIEAR